MVVVPSLDLIIGWNDAKIRGAEMENHALNLLFEAAAGSKSRDLGDRMAVMWDPVEWSIEGRAYSGNPFDVPASVTFTHAGPGQERSTGMFYDGDNTWRFRFTGTRAGRWTFRTSSGMDELNDALVKEYLTV